MKPAGTRRFPPFAEFQADSRVHDPKQLVVWQVENLSVGRRLRALYQGDHVAQVFNGAWAGKTLDEVAPEPLRKCVLETADRCVEDGCAVYTVLSTCDAAGHRVDCERLLLPFGEEDSGVRQMIASLQLISPLGCFERKSVLDDFGRRFEVPVAGLIVRMAVASAG